MNQLNEKEIYSQDGYTAVLADDGRIYFQGGNFGGHSIDANSSSDERILAHWKGYLENNGVEYKAPEKIGMQFDSMQELQTEISKEYQRALAEVKVDYPVTRSEPTLIMMREDEKCEEPIDYTGKLTKKLIDQTLAANPDITELWYENDIDGAESVVAMHDWCDYAPQVASADVLIWKR